MAITNADYKRKYRAHKVADGFCSQCLARPATEGKKTCSECRDFKRKHYLANRNEYIDRAKERYATNLVAVKEYKKQYSSKNADKLKRYKHNYNAIKCSKDICSCYSIDIAGYRYIGETYTYEKRKKEHLSRLRSGNHENPRLQALYNEHGPDAIQFKKLIVLDKTSTKDYLRTLEKYYINQTDKRICLNF